MGILQKIGWKTRRWNLRINLLNILLHDGDSSWGINLIEIVYNYRSYSLLRIDFRLPNGAERTKTVLDNFDILFTRNFLWNTYDKLSDDKLWTGGLSRIKEIKLRILDKIFN